MLSRILPSLLTALAVVVLPQIAAAAEPGGGPPGPGPAARFGPPGWAGWPEATPPTTSGAVSFGPRFNPEVLFKRLDANADGKVTADEIPGPAPERLKALLKQADVNDDRQITPDELAAAVQKMRERAAKGLQEATPDQAPRPPIAGPAGAVPPGPRGFARGPWGARPGRPDVMAGPTPPPGPRGFGRGQWAGWRGWPDAMTGPAPPPGPRGFARRGWEGRPGAVDREELGRGRGPGRGGRGAEGRFGPPQAGPDRRPAPRYAGRGDGLPGLRALFGRLDRDGDQRLSLEEFTAGMTRLYGVTLPALPPAADLPPRPGVRKPRPPRAGADGPWGQWD